MGGAEILVAVCFAISTTIGTMAGFALGWGAARQFARGEPDPRSAGFGGAGPVPSQPAGPKPPR
jgi:hypothetical protein